jgi:polysaccharide biosynthesis protein PslH
LIRELSRRHSITLCSLVNNDFKEEHVSALAPFADEVLTFRRKTAGKGLLPQITGGSRMMMGLTAAVQSMWDKIQELVACQRFDVAFFSGKFTLAPGNRLNGLPVVADICDAGSVRLRGRIQHTRLHQLPLLVLKYILMRRVEGKVMSRTSHSIFASVRDRDALTTAANPRASVVPNGVDVGYWRRNSTVRGLDTLIFTGAMNYAPNVDAAIHLIQDIFPIVRRDIPEAKLMIVGRDPLPALLEASSIQKGITITGFVEDMRPYLELSSVFVAPLRFAAGIQNKVLEAMAMEMDLIASPAAAGGIRTEDGHEAPVTIARGAERFAHAIIHQLREARTCQSSNLAARQFVEKHFDWGQAAAKLESVFDRVVNRSPTTRRAAELLEMPLLKAVSD